MLCTDTELRTTHLLLLPAVDFDAKEVLGELTSVELLRSLPTFPGPLLVGNLDATTSQGGKEGNAFRFTKLFRSLKEGTVFCSSLSISFAETTASGLSTSDCART